MLFVHIIPDSATWRRVTLYLSLQLLSICWLYPERVHSSGDGLPVEPDCCFSSSRIGWQVRGGGTCGRGCSRCLQALVLLRFLLFDACFSCGLTPSFVRLVKWSWKACYTTRVNIVFLVLVKRTRPMATSCLRMALHLQAASTVVLIGVPLQTRC